MASRRKDVRDIIFQNLAEKEVLALLKAKKGGVICGIDEVKKFAQKIGLDVLTRVKDGDEIEDGGILAILKGKPKQIMLSEDILVGLVAKPSGIATAARKAVKLAGGRVKIVSGAWKKMPFQIKKIIRKALIVGGVEIRICKEPFIYLDKNYVRVFGGVEATVKNTKKFRGYLKVIQIRGEKEPIEIEAVKAIENGVNIIFIDTGNITDLEKVTSFLTKKKLREKVKIAFGGSIKIEDIPRLCEKDVDILDVGRAIIDAPMLDISFDVVGLGDQLGAKFTWKN